MIEFLSSIDSQLFLWVNSFHVDALDQFMELISGRWVWLPLYAVITALLVRRFGWIVGLGMALATGLVVAISDQICATYIRPFVERLRPANIDNPLSVFTHLVNDYRGGSYGFPSCHAANTFAVATFISLCFHRVLWPLYGWALLNCWSRMYLGVHYSGDLLVGAFIGTVVAISVALLLRWVMEEIFGHDIFTHKTMPWNDSPLEHMLAITSRGVLTVAVSSTALILLCISLLCYFL